VILKKLTKNEGMYPRFGYIFGLVFAVLLITTQFVPSFASQSLDVNIRQGVTESLGCESKNNCFEPNTATIAVGDKIVWKNQASSLTITSGTPEGGPDGIFDSGIIKSGESFSHTFSQPGVFTYFSMIQPWMQGTVIVENKFSTETGQDVSTNMPPLKQMNHGISSNDISCRLGYQLILNSLNGDPACVSSQTATKLIKRGWGMRA
jgi:plastocyanin